MVAKKELTPAQLAVARHLYERTLVPVKEIAAGGGVSDGWLYNKIKELDWRRRRSRSGDYQYARFLAEAEVLAPAPPGERIELPATVDAAAVERGRLAFTLRTQGAAERVLEACVRTIATIRPGDHAETERCARIVAVVAHAIRDVAELTKPQTAPEAQHIDNDDDDPVPRDMDEFRRELARRIRGFIETRRIGPASEGSDADRPPAIDGGQVG